MAEAVTVRFADAAQALPLAVRFLDFESRKNPGTSTAATYQSRVALEDRERGTTEGLLAMSWPLRYRGYTFSSRPSRKVKVDFGGRGEPRPGRSVVYLGIVLLTIGIAWMFYGKPWLPRRRGARALAIVRERAFAPRVLAEAKC